MLIYKVIPSLRKTLCVGFEANLISIIKKNNCTNVQMSPCTSSLSFQNDHCLFEHFVLLITCQFTQLRYLAICSPYLYTK